MQPKELFRARLVAQHRTAPFASTMAALGVISCTSGRPALHDVCVDYGGLGICVCTRRDVHPQTCNDSTMSMRPVRI
eukprot:3854463-Lingulodinium_polyedra.AAC.1